MNIKHWVVSDLDKDHAAHLAGKYDIPNFLAMLLDVRGYKTDEAVEELLYDAQGLSDPYLLNGMDAAVDRIRHAIDHFERIAIYGDYDADGVTSTAILYSYLEAVGADVMYYIPQRESEGYGMNHSAVKLLYESDVKLIITVDNGISAIDEIAYAKSLGMDVVVTDHHRPHEALPEAVAVINPHLKENNLSFRDLCGAGVVLKLLIAMEDGDQDAIMSEFSDLAAIGTIADVVPVCNENRFIIRAGLEQIQDGRRSGLRTLLEKSGYKGGSLSAQTLAFTLIPRINATGRMGSSIRAVRLLTCEYDEEASALSEEICADNDSRKTAEASILKEALDQIHTQPSLLYSRVLVISGTDWHPGVIGIVAARILDQFGKPVIIISEGAADAKGSGRSIEGFNLFEAISACAPLLSRFGGHPLAAGLSLPAEHIPDFREQINAYAKAIYPEMPAPSVLLDLKLNPASLSPDMPDSFRLLEPFGASNPSPLFGLYHVRLEQITPVGGGGHLRLTCSRGDTAFTCMRFGSSLKDFPYQPGDQLDLTVSLDSKRYRDKPQLTVSIRDLRLSGIDVSLCMKTYRVYEKCRRDEALSTSEAASVTPSRDDIAVVYRLIDTFGPGENLYKLLNRLPPATFNLGKLLFCFDILQERGLIHYVRMNETVQCSYHKTNGAKINIYDSPVFKRLNQVHA